MPIGSGGDVQFGVRITADNRVFVDGVRASTEEVKKLGEGLKQVSRDAEGATKGQAGLTSAVIAGTSATELLTRGVDAAVDAYKQMRDLTREAQQSQSTFEAVLRATGNTAQLSYGQVKQLADSMQRLAGFDDSAVMRAAASLATFGNVVGENFERTIRLAGDLSKVFGGDLQSNVLKLAKALEEPQHGLSGLERTFGRLDDATRRSILGMAEFGDVAGAGNAILREVESRVGGAAVDSFEGLERQIEGTKAAWEDFLKAMGDKVFDAKSREAGFLENTLRALTAAIEDTRSKWEQFRDLASGMRYGPFGALFNLAGQAQLDAAHAATPPALAKPAPRDPFAGIPLPDISKALAKGMAEYERQGQAFERSWNDLVDRLTGKASGLSKDFYDNLQVLERGFRAGKIPLEEYRRLVEQLISEQPRYTKEAQATAAAQREYEQGLAVLNRTMGDHLRSVIEAADREDLANRTRGLTRGQIESVTIARMEERLEILRATEGAEANVRALELEIEARRRLRDAYVAGEQDLVRQDAMQRSLQEQASTWGELADLAGDFFGRLVMDGRDAFRSLGDMVKQFFAQLVALFAQRWVLQIGAAVTGSSALGAAAGQVGQGSLTGAVGNWIGSSALGSWASGAWSSFATGWSTQAAFASGALEATPVFGSAWAQFGASLQSVAGFLGIFAIALAGAAVAARQYSSGWRLGESGNDPGRFNIASPLWTASAMDRTYRMLGFNDEWAAILSGSSMASRIFGHRATQADAWGVLGTVGPGGILGSNWQDFSQQGGWFRSDRRWQETAAFAPGQADFFAQLFRGVSGTTGALGRVLGVDPAAVLAGYSRDFNFQLSENGDPLSDEKLNELFGDLLASVLQEQTALLLEAGGDSKLAEYVRGLKGASDEIIQTIGELVGSMEGLKLLDLKGLDIHALMAWQREGESIGQTFERVASTWTQFEEAFTTNEQKLDKARQSINATFSDLGIAIPATSEDFYELVKGLDLSTQAGRDMFEALMKVAPAFKTVEQAAMASVATFHSIASSLSPSYGRSFARSELEGAVRDWMGLTPWNREGWTVDSTIANIGALLSSGNIGQALTYAQSLGGNAVDVLNRMLAAYGRWNQTMDQGTRTVGSFAEAVRSMTPLERYTAGAPARQGISSYLDQLFLDPQRSTLGATDRLGLAGKTFWELVAKARAGDLNALGQLTGAAESWRGIALEVYGGTNTPGYVDVFSQITNVLGELAGVPGYNERIVKANEEAVTLLVDVKALLQQIAEQGPRDAAMIAGASSEGSEKVARAVSTPPLGRR